MKDESMEKLRVWLLSESAELLELSEEWIREHFPGAPIEYQPDTDESDPALSDLNMISALRCVARVDESQIVTDDALLQKLFSFHTASKFLFAWMATGSERRKATSNRVRNELLRQARSELARMAASERIKNDPKQREKEFVFECWKRWQSTPETYKSKAAFARDMLSKCEHLTSQKKIEDWCRELEAGTLPAE